MIYDSNLQVQKLHVWNTWNTCRYRRYLNFSQDIKKSKHIKWTYHLLDAYISSTHSNPIQKAKIFQTFFKKKEANFKVLRKNILHQCQREFDL